MVNSDPGLDDKLASLKDTLVWTTDYNMIGLYESVRSFLTMTELVFEGATVV